MDVSFPIHKRNFREQIRAGIDPKKTSFVDGSIVNDKPFSAAINAIRERAAYRDVDRRLVYIDPDPGGISRPTGRFQASCKRWRPLSLKFRCMPRSMESWRGLLNSTLDQQNAEGPDCSSTGNCSPRV